MRIDEVAYDDVEGAIIGSLERLVAEPVTRDAIKTRSAWTRAVKDAVRPLAPRFGLRSDTGEWLYDLCWYQMSRGEAGNLVKLGLALESEWNPDPELDGDFQKLVQARADHRVWLFRCTQGEPTARYFGACREQILAFHGTVAGDRYLLVAFDDRSCMLSPQVCVVSNGTSN